MVDRFSALLVLLMALRLVLVDRNPFWSCCLLLIRLTKLFGGKFVKWIQTGPLIISEYFYYPLYIYQSVFNLVLVISYHFIVAVVLLTQVLVGDSITSLAHVVMKLFQLITLFFLWLNNL